MVVELSDVELEPGEDFLRLIDINNFKNSDHDTVGALKETLLVELV